MLDCFDGKMVSWMIGTRPDAHLVDSMLDAATGTPTTGDRPITHSDRGGHYRWSGWLQRIETSSLVRSMSHKGCSPDNAACEGFFLDEATGASSVNVACSSCMTIRDTTPPADDR